MENDKQTAAPMTLDEARAIVRECDAAEAAFAAARDVAKAADAAFDAARELRRAAYGEFGNRYGAAVNVLVAHALGTL